MNGKFGKGFGQEDDPWSSTHTDQPSWNSFGEENPGKALGFENYKPARERNILKAVGITFSVIIAVGVIAGFLWTTVFRNRTKSDSVGISSGVQETGGFHQAEETGKHQEQAGLNDADSGQGAETPNQNLNPAEDREEEQGESPEKDYSYAHGYYYSFLNEQEAKAYDALVKACENLSAKAEVSLESAVQEINVMDAFAYDHPEYYWIFQESYYLYDQTGHISEINMIIPDDVQAVLQKLDSEAEAVAREVGKIEDIYERYKWIFSFIIDNTEYGTAEGVDDQSVTGALLNHLAVCNGYSNAFKFLCDKCGLDCILVTGDALNTDGSVKEAHAWNMILIDDVPYWVDVTWGDPQFTTENYWYDDLKDYSYLCVEDEVFMKKHRIDEFLGRKEEFPEHFRASYPYCTDTRYDYFQMMGLYFDSIEDAEGYIRKNLSEGIPYLWMRFHTRNEQEKAIEDLERGRIWDYVEEENAPYDQSQYFYDDVFYTLIVEFR